MKVRDAVIDNGTMQSNNFDTLYKMVISEILLRGKQVTARGLDFKEVTFQHLILTNPRSRIIHNPARKINKRFMVGEFVWIMRGSPWLDQISYYNKNMDQFSDDGITLHGAYGPRLRHWRLPHGDLDQLTSCLKRLQDDIYTRQAVIVILDPAEDFTVKTKDIPCNDLLQFLYRDGKLHLSCYVRSNDVMLGIPYDVHHWTMLQELFASCLGVALGEYHHFVGSLHIYNSDIDKANAIMREGKFDTSPMPVMPTNQTLGIIGDLKEQEADYRQAGLLPTGLHPYWQEYMLNLVPDYKKVSSR